MNHSCEVSDGWRAPCYDDQNHCQSVALASVVVCGGVPACGEGGADTPRACGGGRRQFVDGPASRVPGWLCGHGRVAAAHSTRAVAGPRSTMHSKQHPIPTYTSATPGVIDALVERGLARTVAAAGSRVSRTTCGPVPATFTPSRPSPSGMPRLVAPPCGWHNEHNGTIKH